MKISSSLLAGLSAILVLAPFSTGQSVSPDTDSADVTPAVPVTADLPSADVAVAEASPPEAIETQITEPQEAIIAPIVRTPDNVSRAAAIYGTYQLDVSDVRARSFSSVQDIENALTSLGGQNSDQLSRGWLAYTALVASQTDDFRAAVRDIESFYGRERVLLGLRNDYTYASTLDGGDGAFSAAMAAMTSDTRRIDGAAYTVREQAYTLQSAGWAKARVGNRKEDMLAALGAGRSIDGSLISALASEEGDIALRQTGQQGAPSLWEGMQIVAETVRFPTFNGGSIGGIQSSNRQIDNDTANRITTLAAFRLLGVDNESATVLQTALADPTSQRCLVKAQLNLRQCVAAVHQQHEVPFCISEHALTEISDCIDIVTD